MQVVEAIEGPVEGSSCVDFESDVWSRLTVHDARRGLARASMRKIMAEVSQIFNVIGFTVTN